MEAVLADLAARFPDGFYSFTRGGKRTETANVYPAKCGFTTNINGRWQVYDHAGKLLSGTHEHNWVGHTLPPRPRPKREHTVKRRFKRDDREFIARKIAQIQGRQP